MWQDTTERDGCADKGIQFFVSSDGELQMARCDSLDFEVLGCVAGEFEDFSGEVFEDSSYVDGSCGAC